MNFKSKQELLDFIYNFLKKQGRRAYDQNKFECRYRTNDGLKCAVGCVLPDKYYKNEMEGKDIHGLILQGFDIPWYIKRNEKFLDDIQYAHDRCDDSDFLSDLKSRFREIAKDHNLKVSAIR